MKKLTKIILIALTLALLLAVPFAVYASDDEPSLKIEAANLSFMDSISILYAVSGENVDMSEVKLLIWTAPKSGIDEYVKGTEAHVLDSERYDSIDSVSCKVFDFDKLGAHQMTDEFYARAYVEVGGKVYYSNLSKYSVIRYAHNKLGLTGTATESEILISTLESMLEYGATVQLFADYKTDRLPTDRYYKITVEGGVLEDGATSGLYRENESVSVKSYDGTKSHNIEVKAQNVIANAETGDTKIGFHTCVPAATVKENEIPATCGKDGSYDEVVYCSLCNKEISRTTEILSKTNNHSLVSVRDNEVAATCKDEGSYDLVIYCFYCETEMSRTQKTITKLETHTPNNKVIENEIAATCGKDGSYDEVVYCFICDKELSRENKIVEKSGVHTPSAKVTENYVAATCGKDGSYDEVVYCYICDKELSRENKIVEKSGVHTPSAKVTENYVAATCQKKGSYDWATYCSVCKCELLRETIDIPADHTFENGICTSCGSPYASEGLLYEYNRDGTCYVTGLGTCTDAHVVIPPVSPEGYRVTGIGERAFYEICDGFNEDWYNRSITIPPTITYIGADAFRYSFSCVYITDIAAWCNITYENRNSNPLYQGSWLYINNEEPTEIIIPDGVTYIPELAFYGCDLLVSVTIPESVTFIDDSAFRNCYALIEVVNNSSLDITCGSFDNGGVGAYAKEVHSGVSKITKYGDFLFYTVGATNYLVGYTGNDTEITLPDSYNGQNYQINDGAFYWRTNISEIIIPDSVTSIGSYAFRGCSNLTNVVIGNGVTSIGGYAFSKCTSLTSIEIPDSVTSIGDYAFSGCTSITSIVIPDSVTSIGDYAFSGCTSLTSVTIGDSITGVGAGVFSNCTSLKDVFYSGTIEDWCNNSFKSAPMTYGENLYINGTLIAGELVIPNGVTSIGSYAFSGCTGITSVVIPDSVTSIGDYAFSGCTGITSIEIPDNVTSIGSYTFYNCTSLASVVIGESVAKIGASAFKNCNIVDLTYNGTEAQWNEISNALFGMQSADPSAATNVYGGIDTIIKAMGNSFSLGIGDLSISLGKASDDYGYSGLWHIDDPYNEGEYAYRITSTTQSNIYLGETVNDWKLSMKPTANIFFGKDSCAVIDITVGRYGEDFVRTGDIRLRSNYNSNATSIGYFEEDGTFRMYTATDGSTTTTLDVAVATTGYTRYVFVIDFENEVIKAYAAADADGELVYQGETKAPKMTANHANKETWMEWAATLDRVEFYCAAQSLTEEEMQLKADLNGDGVRESAMVVDGYVNKEAVKAVQTELHSFLIKSYSTYITPSNNLNVNSK